MTNQIELAFHPSELRDSSGKWTRDAQKYAEHLPPGVDLGSATARQVQAAVRKGRAAEAVRSKGVADLLAGRRHATVREAQEFADFLSPGVRLSSASQAELDRAVRQGMRQRIRGL